MSSHAIPNAKIPALVFPTNTGASRYAAQLIAAVIRQNNTAGRSTVLGLATGSTPVGTYRELIRLHREEGLDFARVVTFNLDEYYPMPAGDAHSYRRWMFETFFHHVNIRPENVNIPSGEVALEDAEKHCEEFEWRIKRAGGIDVQLLGIGRTGHIGFNEPGSAKTSRTRMVSLDPVTRRDAASGFFGEENVPHRALTMGVGTILEARRLILLAFGEHKAPVVQKALELPPSDAVTASHLQGHPDAQFLLDEAAAGDLAVYRTPWELGMVKWTDELVRKAVIWLSLEVDKGLLKLSEEDFREHHLYDLIREHGPAQALCERVFGSLMRTIEPSPAGAEPKTVLLFSPHPDDDVISMGGTLIRLVQQGHKVIIAYMTSGNIAVFDHDALRFVDFVERFNKIFAIDTDNTGQLAGRVKASVAAKGPGQPDDADVLKIKGLIRETEARAGALACGVPAEQCVFMDLRFYRTGTIAKNPIHPKDIDDIAELFAKHQPAQIYVAGELSDPHGTHRVCAEAIFAAVQQVRQGGRQFEVWLYRGAWEEWQPHEIEKAVPLTTQIVDQKKAAIFRHQSQKDRAMFPGGSDQREFWQRAEDRNKHTAAVYDRLGLPEYYAMEAFVLWKG